MPSGPRAAHLFARENSKIAFNWFTWRIITSRRPPSFRILVKQRRHRGVRYLRVKECPRDLSSPLAP